MPGTSDGRAAGTPSGGCTSERLVSLYLDNELPAADRASFEAHLGACPSCAAALRDFERLSSMFARDARAAASPRLIERLQGIPRAEPDRVLARTAFALTAVAAALLMAGSAWLWLHASAAPRASDWELAAVASGAPAADPEDRDLQLAAWLVSDLSRGGRR